MDLHKQQVQASSSYGWKCQRFLGTRINIYLSSALLRGFGILFQYSDLQWLDKN